MKSNSILPRDMSVCAIILCAGTGSRTGLNYNKILHYNGKKTILEMTIDRFIGSYVGSILLVVAQNDYEKIADLTKVYRNVSLCLGGETRTDSVRRGLNELGHCDIVLIHDGARPYVSTQVINSSIESAYIHGSGIVAVPTIDSIKEITNNTVVRSLSRSGLYNIQTPQTFRYDEIAQAYNSISGVFGDDSEVYERAGFKPNIVIGDYDNIKVTTAEDLYRPVNVRSKIGVGFDVHKLVRGRPLILGGVRIHFSKGLKGHSDADVLTHAIMDALLSAVGMPDIGVLFPDKDPKYKNANSINLLEFIINSASMRCYKISNVSAVIMAEKPHLAEYIPDMRKTLASIMRIQLEQINVSATTTEELGIIGKGRGMAASATCLLAY